MSTRQIVRFLYKKNERFHLPAMLDLRLSAADMPIIPYTKFLSLSAAEQSTDCFHCRGVGVSGRVLPETLLLLHQPIIWRVTPYLFPYNLPRLMLSLKE